MIRTLVALSALTLVACTEPDAVVPNDEADVVASAESAGELSEIDMESPVMSGLIAVDIDFGPAARERTELRVELDGAEPRLIAVLRDELGLEPQLVRDADNRLHLMAVDGVEAADEVCWIVLLERAHRYTRVEDLGDVTLAANDRIHLQLDVDLDLDGVGARLEALYGTDDQLADSDGDGLSDWAEIYDGWLLADGTYVQSDPASADSDGDGMDDGEERAFRRNPREDDNDDGYGRGHGNGNGHGDDGQGDDDQGDDDQGDDDQGED
ncbi:MAG: hypothetical protein R3F60_00340 [bacterium]